VEGHASISSDVLSRYAGDAARQVAGVHGLVERALPYRRGVKLEFDEGRVTVELRLAVAWEASIPKVGREVQERVREYLKRMADIDAVRVDVVVDEIA
jgi:uncharacterized alkaline shock family protein YloU